MDKHKKALCYIFSLGISEKKKKKHRPIEK